MSSPRRHEVSMDGRHRASLAMLSAMPHCIHLSHVGLVRFALPYRSILRKRAGNVASPRRMLNSVCLGRRQRRRMLCIGVSARSAVRPVHGSGLRTTPNVPTTTGDAGTSRRRTVLPSPSTTPSCVSKVVYAPYAERASRTHMAAPESSFAFRLITATRPVSYAASSVRSAIGPSACSLMMQPSCVEPSHI